MVRSYVKYNFQNIIVKANIGLLMMSHDIMNFDASDLMFVNVNVKYCFFGDIAWIFFVIQS